MCGRSRALTSASGPPRAAYALPTLFTAGNIFLGYLCIVRSIQGVLHYASNPARLARTISRLPPRPSAFAVILDGLDGRIARMTNTTSEFGRELDSLADIISFGIAPAVLAYTSGACSSSAAHRAAACSIRCTAPASSSPSCS